MSIVLVIVGALLILIAIGGSIKLNESSRELVDAKFRIPLGLTGILLIIFGGYNYGYMNQLGQIELVDLGNKLQIEYPVEKVQVLSPVEGDKVKCRILTMGVYPNSHDKDIWVLLKPADNRYYPQSDHTNTSYKRNGEWQVITRFGGDKGELYELVIYETDSSASEFFSSTIQDWKESLSYPGIELENLPKGANEIDRLSVSLVRNCRGAF